MNQEGTGGTEMTGRIAKHLDPFDWHRLKRTNTPVSEGLEVMQVIRRAQRKDQSSALHLYDLFHLT